MAGKTYNAGQTCIAPDYVMVPAASRDAFVEACKAAVAKMFPTLEKNPDYTSVVNDKHFERVRSYVEDAKTRGAKVVECNPAAEALDAASRKMAPTLVLDPTDEMLCMQEEIFGPVLPVLTYTKLDEAIAYVNDHPRPLALYYFGHDRETIDHVLTETISGGVTINETMLHFAQEDLPFGGVGPSGMGAYHAQRGLRGLLEAEARLPPVAHQRTGLPAAPLRQARRPPPGAPPRPVVPVEGAQLPRAPMREAETSRTRTGPSVREGRGQAKPHVARRAPQRGQTSLATRSRSPSTVTAACSSRRLGPSQRRQARAQGVGLDLRGRLDLEGTRAISPGSR